MKQLLFITLLITNISCKKYMNNNTALIDEIKLVKNQLTLNYKYIPAVGKGTEYPNQNTFDIIRDVNKTLPDIDEKTKKEISQLLNKIKYISYSDTSNIIFVINYAYDFPAFYSRYMESIVFTRDKKFLEQWEYDAGGGQIELIQLEDNMYYLRNKISYPYF